MRLLASIASIGILLACVSCKSKPPVQPPIKPPSPVATVTWDRSGNDVTDYRIYFGWTKDCTPSVVRDVVPQTPEGVKPTYTIDLTGSIGCVAVTARNKALKESPLSPIVQFNRRS